MKAKYELGKTVKFKDADTSLMGEIIEIIHTKECIKYKIGDYTCLESEIIASFTQDKTRKPRARKKKNENTEA